MNYGNGSFCSSVTYVPGNNLVCVYVTDVDADNRSDNIANFNSNNTGVLFNNGDGTFGFQIIYATDINPRSVFVNDVNLDNRPDIIVVNNGDETVGVLLAACTMVLPL